MGLNSVAAFDHPPLLIASRWIRAPRDNLFVSREGALLVDLMASADFKELVRSRTDIVHLVGETVALHTKGRILVGLCPFHLDHNPSMQVYPERQSYKCWACGEGGDCFSWVMKHDSISFPEALELLAERAHLEMPKQLRRDETSFAGKKSLYDVLDWAANEFQTCLSTTAIGERARRYLRERGFTQETISRCKFGYAPDDWEWLQRKAKGRFPTDLLESLRLIAKRDGRDDYKDKFVDRVMFPIHDERGRVVGFGGRVLPDHKWKEAPKYLNSDESPVFHKSRLCYGMSWARDTIKKSGTVLVTEGYTDCLKIQQAGILNAVATLGTSLTESHVTLLKRLAQRVILVYDGDKAGKDASEKALLKFLTQDVDLRILTLPEELDPDEFLQSHGVDAFRKQLDAAPEAWEYQLRLLIARHGVASLDARMRVLEGMLQLLVISPGAAGSVKENLLIGRLPQRLQISEADVRNRLAQLRTDHRSKPAPSVTPPVSATGAAAQAARVQRRQSILQLQQSHRKEDLLESELLQLVLTSPDIIELVRREIGPDDFDNEPLRELLSHCFDLADDGRHPGFDNVMSCVECPDLKGLVVWLDEEARGRDLATRLAQDANEEGGLCGPESLLRRVLDGLKWRRAQNVHRATETQLIERPQEATKLTDEAKELLLRAASFHRNRSAKRTV